MYFFHAPQHASWECNSIGRASEVYIVHRIVWFSMVFSVCSTCEESDRQFHFACRNLGPEEHQISESSKKLQLILILVLENKHEKLSP